MKQEAGDWDFISLQMSKQETQGRYGKNVGLSERPKHSAQRSSFFSSAPPVRSSEFLQTHRRGQRVQTHKAMGVILTQITAVCCLAQLSHTTVYTRFKNSSSVAHPPASGERTGPKSGRASSGPHGLCTLSGQLARADSIVGGTQARRT